MYGLRGPGRGGDLGWGAGGGGCTWGDTAGGRRQVLNASCHTWPGAFIISYRSEDLKEQARAR